MPCMRNASEVEPKPCMFSCIQHRVIVFLQVLIDSLNYMYLHLLFFLTRVITLVNSFDDPQVKLLLVSNLGSKWIFFCFKFITIILNKEKKKSNWFEIIMT